MFSTQLSQSRIYRNVLREVRRKLSKTSIGSGSHQMVFSRKQQDEKSRTHFKGTDHMKCYNKNLSTLIPKAKSSLPSSMISKEELDEFMSTFPELVNEVTSVEGYDELPEVMNRLEKVLQYIIPTGKKNRGLIVVSSYKELVYPDQLSQERLKIANILGWCVEMLQSCILVIDDVIDGSTTRRGYPCWYLQPGVGLNAVNDALLIENITYDILRRHLKNHPAYVNITEIFQDASYKTNLGQSLDCMFMDPNGRPNLEMFTMKKFASLAKFKTTYQTFHMPVAIAMYLANIYDEELHRQARTILLELGQFYQIQNDFLDCYGDPSETGKVGTDIPEGKCTWLSVLALQRGSSAQRQIMVENYGKTDPESEAAIRQLYKDLDIPRIYKSYEEESFNIMKTNIQQLSKGLPHNLFYKIMEKIYKRKCQIV